MVALSIILFIVLYSLNFSVELYLEQLNTAHMKANRNSPPELFRSSMKDSEYKKSIAYTIDKTKFNRMVSLFDSILLFGFIYSGALNRTDQWVRGYNLPEMTTGVIFYCILFFLTTIKSIPVSYYSTFIIEERYGFNTRTIRLWINDIFKGAFVSIILLFVAGYGILWFMVFTGEYWWLWTWIFVFVLGLILTKIFPLWIAPLFNKFEEIPEGPLKKEIIEMCKRADFTVKNIYKIDAGKRSRHSNAYFTGFGRSKRIVLYDTLIERLTQKEIAAVLAHEIGHYKHRHILKGIIITQAVSFLFFYLLSIAITKPVLFNMFLIENHSVYMGIMLLGILWSVLSFWITPLFNWFSRRNEFEADRFSLSLLNDRELFRSLFTKLSVDNLSNLTPHPLYSKFYYSHPPVIERIEKIIH